MNKLLKELKAALSKEWQKPKQKNIKYPGQPYRDYDWIKEIQQAIAIEKGNQP